MTDVTLVCNDKGGVGKSLVTACLASFFAEREEAWPAVIEVDQPRLHKTLGDNAITMTVPPGTDAAQLVEDPERARELFNPLYEPMTERAAVIDIGANALTPFFNWTQNAHIPDLFAADNVTATFAFVAGPSPDALVEVVNAYERARGQFGDGARYGFVLNNSDGSGFEQFQDLEIRAYLDNEHAAGRAQVLELPHCHCRVALAATSRDKLPLHALENFESYAADLELSRPGRVQQWNRLKGWVDQARTVLHPLVPGAWA